MKKKYWVVILLSLFFLAISAFHYDGTKNHANANKGIEEFDSEVNKTNQVYEHEPVDLEQRTDLSPETTETLENQPIKNPEETKEPIDQGDKPIPQDSLDINPVTNKTETDVTNQTETDDTIIIGGSVYELIMDEKKYPNLVNYIEVARNHGAKLYGIPNSDVMTIMKDGKQLVLLSTGVKGVLPEHVDMVRGLFSDVYKGIQENIDFVLETGATVEVKFPNSYTVYSIELREGYLVINHID